MSYSHIKMKVGLMPLLFVLSLVLSPVIILAQSNADVPTLYADTPLLNAGAFRFDADVMQLNAGAFRFDTDVMQLNAGAPMLGGSALWQKYEHRQQQMQRNKYILLGWGIANMVSGAAMLGTEYRDFGVMNASWGAINTGIALFALRGASQNYPDEYTHWDILREEQQFNRIVALNTGLDVGYMIAGYAMMREGRDSMIRQYGTSVLVQGAFLFVYDLFLMVESTRYLNRITVEPSSMGVALRIAL